jgi:hypothetical protein
MSSFKYQRILLLQSLGLLFLISILKAYSEAGGMNNNPPAGDAPQPAWIPPSPGWKIQPWESPPVGGGPPVESVNQYSKAFSTPFATSGQPSSDEMRNSFPGVNSPYMPAPGSNMHDYAGAAGGSAHGAVICAEQCLIGASVKANLAGKESNRKALGEGCLEGCGVKNPQGAISTLLTTFISGGSLANIRYNHNAWLGMLGTTSGGNGGHYGTTFAHESCYEMTISGWKKEVTTKQAASQLLSCNNFGSISDLSLPHQACVMGVMNVLSKADKPPAAAKECDNAPCAIRTMLKTCDPLIFAGENPNVAAQAATTARLAKVHPGLYAGEHAACYNSIMATADKEMTVLAFNNKFQGCQSGGFGSPAMPHHSCVTGVISTLSATDPELPLEDDTKTLIRQCDSFLMYGIQGYAGLGHTAHGWNAYGMPGPIAHMACYSSAMSSLSSGGGKPEELQAKFTACGALAAGNPSAMHHQSCVMQALNSAKDDPDKLKSQMAACDQYLYSSFAHGGHVAIGMPHPGVLPHPYVPGVLHPFPVHPFPVHPAHPLAGIMYGVNPYMHGTHCWCYYQALMSLTKETKPEEVPQKFGACGAASYQTPHSAAHQVCVMKVLGGDAIKDAKSMEDVKKGLSTCDALMVVSCAAQSHPIAGTPAASASGGVKVGSPLVSGVPLFAPGVTHGIPIHTFETTAANNGYHCYKLAIASVNEKTTTSQIAAEIAKCATGHAHQSCITSKIAKAAKSSDQKELITQLDTCESFLHQAGPAGQGQPYNGHWQSHQACYQTALTELTDENIEALPTRLLACAPLVGGNPGLAAHQTCIQNMLRNQGQAASSIGEVKALLSGCDGVLWSGGLYNHGAYEASAHSSCISTAFSGIGPNSKPEDIILGLHSCNHLAGINPTATAYQSCLTSAVKGTDGKTPPQVVSDITSKCSPILGHAYLNSGKLAAVGSNAVNAAALSGIPVLQAAAAAGVSGQSTPLSHQACYSVTLSTVTEETTKDELARKLNLCGAFAMPGHQSPYGATAVSHQACITAVMANAKEEKAAEIVKGALKMCDPLMYPGTASQDGLHMDNPKSDLQAQKHMPFVPENSAELPLLYPTHAVAPSSVHPDVVHPALGDVPPLLESMLTGKEPTKDAFMSRYRPGAMHLHHAPLNVHSAHPSVVHHYQASLPSHPHTAPVNHVHPAAPPHNSHFAPIPPIHAHQLIHFKEKTNTEKLKKSPVVTKKESIANAEHAIEKTNANNNNKKVAAETKVKKESEMKPSNSENKHLEAKASKQSNEKHSFKNVFPEMMKTQDQQKSDSLFDRILQSNKKSESDSKNSDSKSKASLRGGRKLLSNNMLRQQNKKASSPYGYSLTDILKHAGMPLGDKDSSTHFHQGEASSELPRKKIDGYDEQNPIIEDNGIGSQPMSLAKKFAIGKDVQVLSADREDGAEPLVPSGPKRSFGGNGIAESHLKCLLQCDKDKQLMEMHGIGNPKPDDMDLCMKECFRLAAKLYPIAHEMRTGSGEYAHGRPDAALMKLRDEKTEDAPMPQGRNGGFERKSEFNGETQRRSWESAMNYLFDTAPPMTTELSQGEKRTNQ